MTQGRTTGPAGLRNNNNSKWRQRHCMNPLNKDEGESFNTKTSTSLRYERKIPARKEHPRGIHRKAMWNVQTPDTKTEVQHEETPRPSLYLYVHIVNPQPVDARALNLNLNHKRYKSRHCSTAWKGISRAKHSKSRTTANHRREIEEGVEPYQSFEQSMGMRGLLSLGHGAIWFSNVFDGVCVCSF